MRKNSNATLDATTEMAFSVQRGGEGLGHFSRRMIEATLWDRLIELREVGMSDDEILHISNAWENEAIKIKTKAQVKRALKLAAEACRRDFTQREASIESMLRFMHGEGYSIGETNIVSSFDDAVEAIKEAAELIADMADGGRWLVDYLAEEALARMQEEPLQQRFQGLMRFMEAAIYMADANFNELNDRITNELEEATA